MKVKVPAYIKHILEHCGYDNCYSIATIEEEDFDYLKNEVLKGTICAEKVFEGSSKSIEDFEFSRGHQKLLIVVVKFVKAILDASGVDGFSMPKIKNKQEKNAKSKLQKKKASPSTELLHGLPDENINNLSNFDLRPKNCLNQISNGKTNKKPVNEFDRKASRSGSDDSVAASKEIVDSTILSVLNIDSDSNLTYSGDLLCVCSSQELESSTCQSKNIEKFTNFVESIECLGDCSSSDNANFKGNNSFSMKFVTYFPKIVLGLKFLSFGFVLQIDIQFF